MKNLLEICKIIEDKKSYLLEQHGIKVIGVFGSYVRGEQREDSDIDLLVDLSQPPKVSLIGLIELEGELSDLLGVKVDIAIRQNLKKRIGRNILTEVVPI